MFDAQRQGLLSFYVVRVLGPSVPVFCTCSMLMRFRFQQSKKALQLDQLLFWPPKMSYSVSIERLASSSNVASRFPTS